MNIESVDDFVWENYESWTGDGPFKAWIASLPWYNVNWIMNIHSHAGIKREQHWRNCERMELFKVSLDPLLRDCVDPFIDQQYKLYVAYTSIWSIPYRSGV